MVTNKPKVQEFQKNYNSRGSQCNKSVSFRNTNEMGGVSLYYTGHMTRVFVHFFS